MSIPALTVNQNGISQVSADNLNTYVSGALNMANLRAFIGITGMNVLVDGYYASNDGGQGTFYWNASGTGPDDNGVTNVVPSGSTAGCWTRLGSQAGVNTQVTSVTNSDGSLTISPTTGPVVASLNTAHANTFTATQTLTAVLQTGSTAVTQPAGDTSTDVATDAFCASYAPPVGTSRNLLGVQASSTTINYSFGPGYCEITTKTNIAGNASICENLSVTLNISTTGPNGMDTGSALANNTLYVYCIQGPGKTDAVLGTITAGAGGVYGGTHMPSGYTLSGLIGSYQMNGSAQFAPFTQMDKQVWFPTSNVLNITSSVPTSYTSVSLSAFVPLNAKTVTGTVGTPSSGTGGFGAIAADTSGTCQYIFFPNATTSAISSFFGAVPFPPLPLITGQTLYYKSLTSSTAIRIDINGYTF